MKNKISTTNKSPSRLHRESASRVKAKAQADAIHKIMEKLTEEEKYIYKRGRNKI